MLPYLPIGPLLLRTPGLVLLIGVWVGLSWVEKEGENLKLPKDLVYNLVFVGLLAGIVGARLGYAARFLSVYIDQPLSLFSLNPSTLSLVDGTIIGLLAAWVYGIRKELPLRPTLDALAPGLAIFMVALGVAHFLSGDAFGSAANLPWSIYLWDEYRHPTQIYETLLALGVVLAIRNKPLNRPRAGLNFLLFVALTAASRLFLEAFRGDSLIWWGGVRAAQVISLGILLACLSLMRVWVADENGYAAGSGSLAKRSSG